MAKNIACCGLDCEECLAYKATVSDSDESRKQTADQWSKMFNANIEPKLLIAWDASQKYSLVTAMFAR
ncbi:MAG TPA: DUF3795 domain-containing protein [Pseudobacteroides sp.]|uniref:DUF3795 domain-containing protein n=1 Tax=Pseudobacteroides sp. TaxID=1968840 RepID=UPI002F938F5B